ncbi:MAG: hypothetical protein M3112_12015 [Actinomycetia bacterium]|nr:hypothetical protein [Actinomycetes bacterium]
MDNEESTFDKIEGEAKSILGCGLQTIAIWVGVVLVFGLVFTVGMWIFNFFAG